MSIISSFFDDENSELNLNSNIPQMNWRETPNTHVFEFDLPGVSKEDIKLELLEGTVLRVRAERKNEELDTKEERWHCIERVRGNFTRQFRLPYDAKVDEIKASMSNGVLIVTVHKDFEISKKIKDGKKNHHFRREVYISGSSGGGDNKSESHVSKGFGKFVCCKA